MLGKSLIQAATNSEQIYVDDVFSTYLYTGNGSEQEINNGINFGSTSFTEGDTNYNNVVLHLTGDGLNGGNNTIFKDSSNNNYTITNVGGVTQGSFSPFGDRWSYFFDTNSYILCTDSTGLGSNDFTIEFWVYDTTESATDMGVFSIGSTLNEDFSGLAFHPTLGLYVSTSGTSWTYSGLVTGNVNFHIWQHFAIVRSGSLLYIFKNGILQSTNTISGSIANKTGKIFIGKKSNVVNNGRYYISDFRIIKGNAIYNKDFTPQKSKLLVSSNTKLLTCQSNRIVDSANNFAFTANNIVTTTKFSPYPIISNYSASQYGGSCKTINNNQLTVPYNIFNFGTSTLFTVEFWFYKSGNWSSFDQFIGQWQQTGIQTFQFSNINNIFGIQDNTGFASSGVNTNTIPINTWNHFAFVRTNSTTCMLFINGIGYTLSKNPTISPSNSLPVGIGRVVDQGGFGSTGYFSGLRVVTGTALYTVNFTPPTTPPTNITNTTLLLNFVNGAIYDNAGMSNFSTANNVIISTSNKKFGNSSIYFDGSGDNLELAQPDSDTFQFLTSNCTIEFWMNSNSYPSSNTRIFCTDTGISSSSNLIIGHRSSGKLFASVGTTIQGTSTLSIGTWYHVAFTREGTSIKLFLNGILEASGTSSASITPGKAYIGGFYLSATPEYFNGYIQDFRITKGISRYSGNFSIPTEAFPTNSKIYSNFVESKGGMVWIRKRNSSGNNILLDTVRGDNRPLVSNSTDNSPVNDQLISFNSNGFTAKDVNTNDIFNYVSWAFRKATRFFDVVTYTGDGNSTRWINHSLGIKPGAIIVKAITTAPTSPLQNTYSNYWGMNFRKNDSQIISQFYLAGVNGYFFRLNTGSSTTIGETPIASTLSNAYTDTAFNVGYIQVTGSNQPTDNYNLSGVQYVAYLFAHDTTSTGIIQCGTIVGDGNDITTNLGWEPQWVYVKDGGSGQGKIFDSTRKFSFSDSAFLSPENNAIESFSGGPINATSNGFKFSSITTNNRNYFYIAIRRSTKPPTNASQVFNASVANTTIQNYTNLPSAGFPVDLQIGSWIEGAGPGKYVVDRTRPGKPLYTNLTDAELATEYFRFDSMTNTLGYGNYESNPRLFLFLNFKRAAGFMDVVCYAGNSTAGRTVNHNLGVVPELMIIKALNKVDTWLVYCSRIGANNRLFFNTNASSAADTVWNSTTPTITTFSLSNSSSVNGSSYNYVAYLFATLPGISKVGSYTGNGSTLSIDAGFGINTSGFILIKRTDNPGDWYVWNSARGIYSSNDPHLSLNSTAAEIITDDSVDPFAGGFTVNQNANTNINVSTGQYIYLAIAGDSYSSPTGEALYTTPGTFSWTAPSGVTSVSVVCVGGGGGNNADSNSGSGGGLGWKNNIPVTPGQNYTVVVGGASANSYFSNSSIVLGAGGGVYTPALPKIGTYIGDGGGNGGAGVERVNSGLGGGGGAGGYIGNGGNGGNTANTGNGYSGVGGGGGGGYVGTTSSTGGAGGGVGIYGIGLNGAGGTSSSVNGGGGSGAIDKNYGGGTNNTGTKGAGTGAVRIIWGGGSFPYNAT